MKYLLNLILLLFVVVSVKGQKVKPALNLTKGSTYYMISSVNSSILQTINTEDNKVILALSFKMAFKVTDILDSVYNMEVSYQSLSMKIRTANGNIEMDSKKNDVKDIPSNIVAAMMNKPFNISITKSGKIISVENVERMITGVFNSFTQVDSVKKEQIKNQFLQSFGSKAFKGNMEITTAIFPDEYVRKNKKWVHNSKLESMMIADLKTSYKILDITDDSYLIHGDGIIATDNNAEATSINGLPVKYHLTGTMVSDIKADKTTGWITELKVKQMMKGDFEIQDNPKVPGGETIPITISNEQVTTDK